MAVAPSDKHVHIHTQHAGMYTHTHTHTQTYTGRTVKWQSLIKSHTHSGYSWVTYNTGPGHMWFYTAVANAVTH